MKLVLVVLVLFVVGGAYLYYGGGYASFDPSEQGRQVRGALKKGMSWPDVVEIAREPQQYQSIIKKTKTVGGREVEDFVPSIPTKFDRGLVGDRVENNELPYGFIFIYQFSNSVAFSVWFDGKGNVSSVQDEVTMADMLQVKDE